MKWFKKIDFHGLNEEVKVIREEERQPIPGYTCDPKLHGRKGQRKLPLAEVALVAFYEQFISEESGGWMGGLATHPTSGLCPNPRGAKHRARECIVKERFQARIWGLERPAVNNGKSDPADLNLALDSSIEPVTSRDRFNWELSNGTQFHPEEYIVPAELNEDLLQLLFQEHGLDIGPVIEPDQLDEVVRATAYEFHMFLQQEFEYCLFDGEYDDQLIPVIRSILSGTDLVEEWEGKQPAWFYRRSGHYLELVEACQNDKVNDVGLQWASEPDIY